LGAKQANLLKVPPEVLEPLRQNQTNLKLFVGSHTLSSPYWAWLYIFDVGHETCNDQRFLCDVDQEKPYDRRFFFRIS